MYSELLTQTYSPLLYGSVDDVIRKADRIVPAGYTLLEVVGSKKIKVDNKWVEFGYYLTLQKESEA